MIGYLLTAAQKNSLLGQEFKASTKFNPIQDASNRWVLTESQVTECDNPDFQWVKDLPQVDFLINRIKLFP